MIRMVAWSLTLVLLAAAWSSRSLAGPNNGGTLLVHALENINYTTDNDGYCNPLQFARSAWLEDCALTVSEIPYPTVPAVWLVYAAFSESNFPQLAGVEFGITYSPGLSIVDHGACADITSPMSGWPASGTGTIVVWSDTQTERLVPVYWFAGYSYSAATGMNFQVGPHPINGGHFGDRSLPSVLDQIADYGSLGIGSPGNAPCPVPARTYAVDAEGTGDFPTIQDAFDLAAPGSVIELADGIYSGDGNRDLDFNSTTFTLRSASGNPEQCVIDCGGSFTENHRGIRFNPGAEGPSLISGIGIRNGYAGDQLTDGPFDRQGGAIRINGGQLTISNCIFENCGTESEGGALAGGAFPLELIDCSFINNWSDGGAAGAMEIGGGADIRMTNCRFEGNTAAGADGGAIRIVISSLEARDCVFTDNVARRGAGVFANLSTVRLEGCTFASNTSTYGAGLFCRAGTTEVDHGTFSDNSAANGSAIQCDAIAGSLAISSSIFAFNRSDEAIGCGSATITVDHTDIFGNDGGDWVACLSGQLGLRGNLSVDPLFCDRASGDFGLSQRSPCATRGSVISKGIIGAWPVSCESGAPKNPVSAHRSSEETGLRFAEIVPNPAAHRTSIAYTALPGTSIRIEVFDPTGRRVHDWLESSQVDGSQSIDWDLTDASGDPLPSGIYYVRLTERDHQLTRKVVVAR